MQRKYTKLISLLLTAILLVTTLSAVMATPTAIETDLTLYVCSPGYDAYDTKTDADGTAEKPFETVYDLVTWVNTNYPNLTSDDTVTVIVDELDNYTGFDSTNSIHNMTVWSDTANIKNEASMAPHKFKMVITSPQGKTNHLAFSQKWGTSANISNVDLMIGGPTVFDNIILVAYANNKNIAFEGASVEFTENCAFQYTKNGSASKFGTLVDMTLNVQLARCSGNITKSYAGATYTINNGKIGSFFISASRTGALETVYSEDVNIIANHPELALTFVWGGGINAKAKSNFLKNLNINIKDAASVTNTNKNILSPVTVTGALQVVYPEDITFDMSAITNLTAGSKWYLVNKTGNPDSISFTATAGVYNVAEGLTVNALDAQGNVVKTSEEGVLDLRSVGAGTYSIVIGEDEEPDEPEEPEITVTHNYDEYITYRSDLDNTRAKLKADGDVNVVYFGGSVTAGSGASDKNATSWRALTGNWIKEQFPNANVTNHDQAIGETGTYLGSYRVARDVIGRNPDLLFIEYSINDYYNQTGYARASMQFETIVRQVKEALPNCDIVVILVTDYDQVDNARKRVLHAAARAHSDIAATYGLPVINVGFALGDALGANWTEQSDYKNDPIWKEYITDNVHPSDKGYEVYFNVIKEYLSNNLIMEYNGETAFTELTEIPTMINKYLFNGNVTFIKPTQDMIKVNAANDTATKSRKLQYRTDRGGIAEGYGGTNGNIIWFGGASYIDCGDVLEFEFTGTELIMITSAHYSGEYSMISIDGGEPYKVDHVRSPIVLATGLSTGKHTVKFISISQNNSLIINGFYTRDITKSTNTLNICDLVKADECINSSATPDETDFFDYSNNWENDVADIDALKQILLNK